ncbi:MAG: hypothetical protein AB1710_02425 [Pseudomonadota bacterium]
MATVNFSVPEEVKRLFNQAFAGRNKSAIIADLMVRAVEEQAKQRKRAEAIDRLLSRRAGKQPVSEEEIRVAREELRE